MGQVFPLRDAFGSDHDCRCGLRCGTRLFLGLGGKEACAVRDGGCVDHLRRVARAMG